MRQEVPTNSTAEVLMKKGNLVIIDDDREMRSLLEDFFKSEGYLVRSFESASEGVSAILGLGTGALATPICADVVISDINMPGVNGIELATKIHQAKPEVPVILITAFGSIETAIQAMRAGAFDYIVKPFKLAELAVNVERAFRQRHLQIDNQLLRQEVKRSWSFNNIIGKSAAMRSVFDLAQRVAQANANVLITGESGTGKEMVARAIHETGPRKTKPFVAINCTAIPDTLLESELFGHAKGSFTGAIQRKKGLFEEAHEGTLFLDEIGDMDLVLQSKLLRVIQEKKVRAVGDNNSKDVDVRIIAATHKDLKAAIKEGKFREDLFYRLAVIPVQIPSLRERKEDIPILAEYFLRKYSAANGSQVRTISSEAMQKLMHLKWEGNVRELENVIERAVVLCRGNQIEGADLPAGEDVTPEKFFADATGELPTLTSLEQKYIELVLEKTGGRKDRAAGILGINRRTLYRKEREFNLVNH
jgi:two-component system, NtrC family, response regulator HydG